MLFAMLRQRDRSERAYTLIRPYQVCDCAIRQMPRLAQRNRPHDRQHPWTWEMEMEMDLGRSPESVIGYDSSPCWGVRCMHQYARQTTESRRRKRRRRQHDRL